jgi:DNA repair protein RecO (recombination protein O)
MTAENGLVDAFVFGGPKSKLRSLAAPYSAGKAFIYHDPVRDFSKLSDFEVIEPFSGLREGLRKIWAASLIAEFLTRTSGGGGDFPAVLGLALEALRGLEDLGEDKAEYPALLFLWRMLGIIGLMPDTDSCASCGAGLNPDEAAFYSAHSGGFLCGDCERAEAFSPQGSSIVESCQISGGAHRFLARSAGLPFAAVLGANLAPASLESLKALVYGLARRAAEGPLVTLSSGAGIL